MLMQEISTFIVSTHVSCKYDCEKSLLRMITSVIDSHRLVVEYFCGCVFIQINVSNVILCKWCFYLIHNIFILKD